MLQSKQRLLELNAKLAETLTSKGVTATADETTTALVDKVGDITSGDDSILKELISGSRTTMIVPEGFESVSGLSIKWGSFADVYFPDSVTKYDNYLFYNSKNIKTVKLSHNANVTEAMLQNCPNIEEIYVPEGVTKIGRYAFNNCTSLKTVYLPNTITQIGIPPGWFKIFEKDTNLEFVTLGNGFNANNLDVSWSDKFSRETILQWLNALADRTGQTAYKLAIGATNLAKLTEQDILIATNKNWTLT